MGALGGGERVSGAPVEACWVGVRHRGDGRGRMRGREGGKLREPDRAGEGALGGEEGVVFGVGRERGGATSRAAERERRGSGGEFGEGGEREDRCTSGFRSSGRRSGELRGGASRQGGGTERRRVLLKK